MRADLVVVGGGVVGLSVARTFLRRHPDARVVVLEKETRVGAHASGRNSGVLHAGFYYSADSLKARFSMRGCAAWKAFCEEHDVPCLHAGKLVVARSEADHEGLEELLARGTANGVVVRRVDAQEARDIEPYARTVGWALHSPSTATVNPTHAMNALARVAECEGVRVRLGVRYLGRASEGRLQTSDGPISAGWVVNAAGAHADVVARDWGVGEAYRLVPFRGTYLLGGASAPPIRACIYPVPDLGMPFLGVHFTTTPSGTVKIGPTAFPAAGREAYRGVRGSTGEALGLALVQAQLALRNASVRRHALRELVHQSPRALALAAAGLADGIRPEDFTTVGPPGIRAQLVDRTSGRLVSDFVLEHGERSVHILNAVSPAFTCAFPFAAFVCDQLADVT